MADTAASLYAAWQRLPDDVRLMSSAGGVMATLGFLAGEKKSAALALSIQLATFFLHAVPNNSELLYDASGASTHISLVLNALARRKTGSARSAIASVMSVVWAARLGSFLFTRILKDGGVDHRFDAMKRAGTLAFGKAWVIQAMWCFIGQLPVLLCNAREERDNLRLWAQQRAPIPAETQSQQESSPPAQQEASEEDSAASKDGELPPPATPSRVKQLAAPTSPPLSSRSELTNWDYLGISIWLAGMGIEILADAQKTAFRAVEANRHEFITTGLFARVRHPNHTGEVMAQFGLTLLCSNALAPWSLDAMLAWLNPLFSALIVSQVSGVPMLEAAAQKKWGDRADYRAYVQRTFLMIPGLY